MNAEKERLINSLINEGWLKTRVIIDAFRKVPREEFVLKQMKERAYDNYPLPIIEGQTISQPLTIAAMTEALEPIRGHKILEVGAGSGYQAAILAEIVGNNGKIITTERLQRLADFASDNLERTGYKNVFVMHCDGSQGYEKFAPYDRIIVTANAPSVPEPLIDQLKKGGRMVIPVGDEMFLVEKNGKIKRTSLGYYVFVPLIGKHGHTERNFIF
ncbi:MAG: protein-L-isoaspartate(D-aspartate) O-methyltransferase [Candidatus Aenigmatarchaeota archaeon]